MVLGPVEFDTAGNPGTGKSYKRRLDDMIVIYEMALADFVVCHLYAASQFGKNHHLDVFVLDEDGVPFVVSLLIGDRLDDRIGIDDSAGTLIDSLFKENRIFLGLSYLIGRDNHCFFPCFDHEI